MIMTGVRAYERRSDLRAYNHRLLDYVERGGTVIVEYNKMEFNREEYGPFSAKVSGNRVADEKPPGQVLQSSHPMFNYPTKLDRRRGPAGCRPLVPRREGQEVHRPGGDDESIQGNPGEKLGVFVEGRYGKGRWMYVDLWRQLPAGTGGAYRLVFLGQPVDTVEKTYMVCSADSF